MVCKIWRQTFTTKKIIFFKCLVTWWTFRYTISITRRIIPFGTIGSGNKRCGQITALLMKLFVTLLKNIIHWEIAWNNSIFYFLFLWFKIHYNFLQIRNQSIIHYFQNVLDWVFIDINCFIEIFFVIIILKAFSKIIVNYDIFE